LVQSLEKSVKESSRVPNQKKSYPPDVEVLVPSNGGRPRKNREREILLLAELGFDRAQIAKATGLKRKTLRNYLYGIRKANGSVPNTVLKTSRKCSCGSTEILFDRENGEVVCTKCGLVLSSVESLDNRLPFDTTYALTNHLAFGKSLGGTLPRKELYEVLARGPKGTEDLPIRSTQIQVMSSAVDPPVVKTMLNYGSRIMTELGLNRDDDVCHVLSDQYGRIIRTAAAFLQVSKMRVQPHMVARAALYHILIQLYPVKAEQAWRDYPFSNRHLRFIEQLAGITKKVEKH